MSESDEVREEPRPVVEPADEGPVFGRGLQAALGRAPIWLLASLPVLLLAAVPMVWTRGWFADALAHSYAPGSQHWTLDASFREDHQADFAQLGADAATFADFASALLILFAIFAAGGYLQVFLERTEGHSVRRFLLGGARHFWRYLRVFLLVVLALSLGAWLFYGKPWDQLVLRRGLGLADASFEEFESERAALSIDLLRQVGYALWFGLVMVWAIYTRTRLAMRDARSSIAAGIGAFFTILFHPIRTLRPMVLLFVVEALVLAAAGVGTLLLQGDSPGSDLNGWRVASMLAVTVAAILWRTIVHMAKYGAAIHVLRDLARSDAAGEPWGNSVGGPGGPQYPIESGD